MTEQSDRTGALLPAAAPRRIGTRAVDRIALHRLLHAGVPPLLARLYAARGITCADETVTSLDRLLPPTTMKGLDAAAAAIADAIDRKLSILVVGDYDCDGATGIAVAVLGLRAFGARVDYLVPHRFRTGYGLTPEVVEQAVAHPRLGKPDLIVTVDNGIAASEGVRAALEHGIRVVVTDHHLPGAELPPAEVIVNPNQPGCAFASKAIAGVGVAFYLLIALRAHLRARAAGGATAGGATRDREIVAGATAAATEASTEPRLVDLLDLVALGTVADVVRLDANNRILVAQGLRRIRSGRARPGLLALLNVAGREPRTVSAETLGFVLGPRLNAAGRLADMSIGVECLLADDAKRAAELADTLDRFNRERRQLQESMTDQAVELLAVAEPGRHGLVVHHDSWNHGVIGLVASRMKEAHHRPCFALAPESDQDGASWRGSGRSIPGVHLRDVLEQIDRDHPGMLVRYGGHAMAAGLTLAPGRLQDFDRAFDEAVQVAADPECFLPELLTDGPLDAAELSLQSVQIIDDAVWGQGFAPPLFSGRFDVLRQRRVKDRHLRLDVRSHDGDGTRLSAIAFNRSEPVPERVSLAYRIRRNEYQGRTDLSLMVEHLLEN